MAKTINEDIDFFDSESKATKAFIKETSADLLYAPDYKGWYIDRSKTALIEWPNLYTLIETK